MLKQRGLGLMKAFLVLVGISALFGVAVGTRRGNGSLDQRSHRHRHSGMTEVFCCYTLILTHNVYEQTTPAWPPHLLLLVWPYNKITCSVFPIIFHDALKLLINFLSWKPLSETTLSVSHAIHPSTFSLLDLNWHPLMQKWSSPLMRSPTHTRFWICKTNWAVILNLFLHTVTQKSK